MHLLRAFKYLSPLSFYLLAFIAFSSNGWYCWLPLMYSMVLIPLLELFLQPDTHNLEEAATVIARNNRAYDFLLYIILPLQYGALFYFLFSLQAMPVEGVSLAGRIGSMGMLCGTFGINVAHELGHRVKPFERIMAKALLATSLYMHFYIEHNKGHHKLVATHEDPSSARKNEMIYTFFFRTIIFSYLSAWNIANKDCVKKQLKPWSFYNEMIQAHLLQLALLLCVGLVFGWMILCCFIISATIGILLLEMVNYIEHYGLSRKKTSDGHYERAMPHHSWNSDHPLGRIMLFELTRHSDHHYLASKKYQVLDHHKNAPQLPTGYPGSMLLSLIPPLWFRIMNKKISALEHA
jgi:alkane 1-monooxygenase